MSSKPVGTFYRGDRRRSSRIAAQLAERESASAAAAGDGAARRPTRVVAPRPRLLGPDTTWQVFALQSDALTCAAAAATRGLMTFACEARAPEGGGRRAFLVCHPKVFWQCDVQKRDDERCSYEVIPDGHMCKLYLDLEFERDENPGRDGQLMVEQVIRIITDVADYLFNVEVRRDDVIDLTASSSSKCSHHLIFQTPGLIFASTTEMGAFIKDVCAAVQTGHPDQLERLGLRSASPDDIAGVVVNGRDNAQTTFIDESVYTRNRNFRLYRSTKYGKHRPLIKSANNKFEAVDEESFFLSSLVTFIADRPARPRTYLSAGSSVHQQPGPSGVERSRTSNSSGPSRTAGPSQYPGVDQFIRSLMSPGGIRRCRWFPDSRTLVYDIVGYRYCENVQREHRSNNIIMVVNVQQQTYYQKCHDPTCGDFRSNACRLPAGVLPSTADVSSSSSEDELDDNEESDDNADDEYYYDPCHGCDCFSDSRPYDTGDIIGMLFGMTDWAPRRRRRVYVVQPKPARCRYPVTRVPFSLSAGGPATAPMQQPPPEPEISDAQLSRVAEHVGNEPFPDEGVDDLMLAAVPEEGAAKKTTVASEYEFPDTDEDLLAEVTGVDMADPVEDGTTVSNRESKSLCVVDPGCVESDLLEDCWEELSSLPEEPAIASQPSASATDGTDFIEWEELPDDLD